MTGRVAARGQGPRGGAPPRASLLVVAGAGMLLLPALVAGDTRWLLEPRGVAVALWLGVGTVAAGYLLFASGLRLLAAPTVATLTLAEPLTAAGLGVLLLGERTGGSGLAGVALIVAGLGLLVVRDRRRTRDGRGLR